MISSVSEDGPLLFQHANVDFEVLLETLLSYRGYYAQTTSTPAEALCRALVANFLPTDVDEDGYAAAFRKWWSRNLARRMEALEKKLKGSGEYIVDLLEQLGLEQGWFPSPAEVRDAMFDGNGGDEPHVGFLDSVCHRLWPCRKFFRTSDGRFGVGPRGLTVSDEVWLLEGGKTPFILRREPDGHSHRIIGEAYIHGVMHGELVTPELISQMGPVEII